LSGGRFSVSPVAEYWEEPPGDKKGLTDAYWNDPWPDLQGMLTADRIDAYNTAVGGMIRPFEPKLLKTASYELTLGPRCVVEGENVLLDPATQPRLEIPPNSIAFVPMEQRLYLPHYIVGRFDLQIKFIYKGLLLGTGPQVDPGFQGILSCPLHNISNDPIRIKLGEPFAKLDFAKTAPRIDEIREAWKGIETEDELAEWLKGSQAPAAARLFKKGKPESRQPIYGYSDNGLPTSSVGRLRQETQAKLNWFQRRGFQGAALGAISILFGVPAFVFGVVDATTDPLATKDALTRAQADTGVKLQRQSDRIRELERQIAELRRHRHSP
jgi:deoxycytidine triphosphate deaminase